MGSKAGSELASVPSEDLDAYIAELIVQKSRTKQAHADQRGIASYLEPDDTEAARVPNTNKRFLASVIRNVEGHNSALRRQQQRSEQRSALSGRGESAGSSKMRGWSADERDTEEKARSGRSDVQSERSGEGMSSKMDKYFEEPDPDSEPRKSRQRRSEPNDDKHSSSSKRRHDKERTSERDKHRHSSHRSNRSSRTERSERSERSRSGRSRPDDGASDDEQRHHKRSHTSRRSSDRKSDHRSRSRKRSASPPPAPPPSKVREWDLGK